MRDQAEGSFTTHSSYKAATLLGNPLVLECPHLPNLRRLISDQPLGSRSTLATAIISFRHNLLRHVQHPEIHLELRYTHWLPSSFFGQNLPYSILVRPRCGDLASFFGQDMGGCCDLGISYHLAPVDYQPESTSRSDVFLESERSTAPETSIKIIYLFARKTVQCTFHYRLTISRPEGFAVILETTGVRDGTR